MWLNGKTVYTGGGLIADVPAQHRLSDRNPTFRANLLVAEGAQSSTAILNQPGGVLLQELPFSIELKKFIVEYYSTGMPKLFASDIMHARQAKPAKKCPARVEVNHPASHKGVEIYQSSFDDGGSSVTLKAVPMAAATKPFEIQGTIGGTSSLTNGQGDSAEADARIHRAARHQRRKLRRSGGSHGQLGRRRAQGRPAARPSIRAWARPTRPATPKELRNVGPSVSYKLRDAAGQAREFHNYMLPVKTDPGENSPAVYLMGVRETPSAPFQYLRIPVDAEGGMETFAPARRAGQPGPARAGRQALRRARP